MKKLIEHMKTGERFLKCLFLFLLTLADVHAQQLTVKSMEVSPTDISASKFVRKTPDGKACALMKVQLAAEGCTFTGNVVGNVDYKTGEYWVYMIPGAQRLSIAHSEYGTFDVDFRQYGVNGVEEMTTYILTLLTPQTGQGSSVGNINVNYNPIQSEVWLDGKLIGSSPDIFLDIAVGNYPVEIRKHGYATQKQTITVTGGETVTLEGTLQAYNPVETFTVRGAKFKMILVEGGTFKMGDRTQHQVTLTNDYYIGETEVTQELWKAVMGRNPSPNKGSQMPVHYVTWGDCQKFVQKLSKLTGRHFRLPTEAEWEYAARGGHKSQGYRFSGSNIVGTVASNGSPSHEVKFKAPNELGIYDMSGNVEEWCQDYYAPYENKPQTNPTGPSKPIEPVEKEYHVFRGGSWYTPEPHIDCAVSARDYGKITCKSNWIGLRVVFSAEE